MARTAAQVKAATQKRANARKETQAAMNDAYASLRKASVHARSMGNPRVVSTLDNLRFEVAVAVSTVKRDRHNPSPATRAKNQARFKERMAALKKEKAKATRASNKARADRQKARAATWKAS